MTNKAESSRGGNAWDDPFLMRSFDAMSNHKTQKTRNAQSSWGGADGFLSSAEGQAIAGAEKKEAAARVPQEDRSQKKTVRSENPPPTAEPNVAPQFAEVDQGVVYGSEEYNKLLSKYYKLEEKRAKMMEQLHVDWSYQYPAEATQDYATAANQAYYPAPMWATGGYLSPYPAWQPTARSGCCNCVKPCVAEKSPTSANNDNALNKSIAAALKAVSVLTIIADGEMEGNENEAETSSTTDLSAVLAAWYSAGLYTGKYLAEQSGLKKSPS